MDSRKVILLVGALIVAAVCAFFARSLFAGSPAPQAVAAPAPPKPDGPSVLIATRALPVGTILDATALKLQPWPKELVESAYFIEGKNLDLKALVGTVVRHPITAGQPITQGALVKPGDRGFLAAALGPGMRAVTIPVQGANSVAGFVFPGDRIDLMLTQTVAGGGVGAPLKVSETILRNLRVLATDQRTDNTVGEDGKMQVQTYNTVTIEATPKIAERVAVAQTLGELAISLRSIADNQAELEAALASGAEEAAQGGDPKAEKAVTVRIASAPEVGRSSFATGGEVSRFQRTTVPGSPVTEAGPVNGPIVRLARGSAVEEVEVGQRKLQGVAATVTTTDAATMPPPILSGGNK
jgi:pilus assembly protein CpaB